MGGKEKVEPAAEDIDTITEAIRTGFLKLDERMRQMPEVGRGGAHVGDRISRWVVWGPYG